MPPEPKAASTAPAKTWPCVGGCGKGRPAPGDKCPDCILADRRAREAQARPAATEEPVPPDVRAEALASSGEVAQARDRAILDELRLRPATTEDRLLRVMPMEQPPLTLEQKLAALNSTLTRLRLKRQIERIGDTWGLTARAAEPAVTASAARYEHSRAHVHEFRVGQAVRYKPGAGTYGYEDAIEADGRIPATVIGVTPTRVRIEFAPLTGGGGTIERAVDAGSLDVAK